MNLAVPTCSTFFTDNRTWLCSEASDWQAPRNFSVADVGAVQPYRPDFFFGNEFKEKVRHDTTRQFWDFFHTKKILHHNLVYANFLPFPMLGQQRDCPDVQVMNFHFCSSIPINSLWEALEMKARSPEKFMDVSDMKVTDEDGYLSRNMTIRANLNDDSQ